MSAPRQTQILEQALAPWLMLSTDTKPVNTDGVKRIPTGQQAYELDTGYTWIYNGYAWIPKIAFPGQTINYKQISLASAETVNVMTANAQSLFIDAVVVHVPDDLSEVETFTSLAVATNDDPAIEIMSATEGAKANLTGNFYHVYRGPVVTASTEILQATVTGTAAAKVANITVLWRPVVAGGYYLNA